MKHFDIIIIQINTDLNRLPVNYQNKAKCVCELKRETRVKSHEWNDRNGARGGRRPTGEPESVLFRNPHWWCLSLVAVPSGVTHFLSYTSLKFSLSLQLKVICPISGPSCSSRYLLSSKPIALQLGSHFTHAAIKQRYEADSSFVINIEERYESVSSGSESRIQHVGKI